jgi:hypothetical protein
VHFNKFSTRKPSVPLVRAAIIAACASACAPASWALAPTATVDVELFLAGATAEKNLIPNLLGGFAAQTKYSFSYSAGTALCQSGTLDFFYDSKASSRAGYDYRAYSCTLTTNTSLLKNDTIGWDFTALAGKKILIHYRMKNGSWYGTGPLARSQPVTRMKIDANCITSRPSNTGSTPVPATVGSFPLANVYNTPSYVCPTESTVSGTTTINTAQLVTTDVPDVGIADNEPAIFVKENAPNDGNANANGNPTYDAAITDADLNNVTTTPVFSFPLAIAATKKLVNALQVVQGKTVTASGTTVADTDRPSINFLQISSLLTSNGGPLNTNWLNLGISTSNTYGSGASAINICRRISAVATQITANAAFGNYPCSDSGVPPSKTSSSASRGIYRIIENDLIPDERACLQAFNNATTTDSTYSRGVSSTGTSILETVNSGVDGTFAIGPLFIDNKPSSETYSWDFLAVDGINPTVPNVVAGTYRYINTAVINLRAGSDAADTSTLKGQLTGLLIAKFQEPSLLAVQDGFLAIPESGYTPGTDGNNIARGSNSGQTCKPVSIMVQ